MYGRKAMDLIRGLDRSSEDALPQYNAEGVRAVCDEMRTINSAIEQDCKMALAIASADVTQNDENEDDPDATLRQTQSEALKNAYYRSADFKKIALERNQRCLVAYHYNRMERLRQLRWSYGAVLPQEVRANLSEKENEWFINYCSALNDYMAGLDGLNLTLHQLPPQDHFLHVRVLVEYGEYETEDGETISLKKFTRHVLPRSECENLIRQGILEHITG